VSYHPAELQHTTRIVSKVRLTSCFAHKAIPRMRYGSVP
jgi:hypothetical protein